MKRDAVRTRGFVVLEGRSTKAEAADALRVSRRTLQNWERRGDRPLPLRGRPRTALDPEARSAIMECLDQVGPHLGVEPLKRLFPAVPRRAIERVVVEHREWYRRAYAQDLLTWRVPGAVWAMDHTEGPRVSPSPSIIAVKDLGSEEILAWKRSPPRAEEVIREIEELTEREGAPLVLKTDRGSGFTAQRVEEFLNSRGIIHLLSPPRRPRYNGAIEATIRWLKLTTEHHALLSGNAREWTTDALERAKEIANTWQRSRRRVRVEGISKARPVITDGLRNAFRESVQHLEEALLREGLGVEGGKEHRRRSQARRQAIERALVAHDILHITRRRIPLRLRSLPWEKIG